MADMDEDLAFKRWNTPWRIEYRGVIRKEWGSEKERREQPITIEAH